MKVIFGIALILVLSLAFVGAVYASSGDDSLRVSGAFNVNLIPIEALADIDGDGVVGDSDLALVVAQLGASAGDDGELQGDINHDGIINIFDVAIVARYLGQEVPI